MKFSDVNFLAVNALRNKTEQVLQNCSSLEDASQKFIEIFYEEFSESVILARLFATVPFKKLPAANQDFVSNLAESKGISHLLSDKTLVLSLLGTRGRKDNWNDRRKSNEHVGIPIVSLDFIDSIPMMSRLLKELGVEVNWIDREDTKIVIKLRGSKAGVFFVCDASTDTDQKGRKIISAQDFVEEYKIKTVFGFGGGYGVSENFITTIIFTTETIDRTKAEQLMFMINMIKSATTELVLKGKIFA